MANALFAFMDRDTAFLASGVLALSIALFALRHLRPLIALKHECDTFSRHNRKFHTQQLRLCAEVDRAGYAIKDLGAARGRIERANVQNRENLGQFREMEHNMKAIGVESLSQISTLQQTAQKIEDKWHEALYQHERGLLTTVFERIERSGSRRGMNHEEFQVFASMLPQEYQQRFERMVCHLCIRTTCVGCLCIAQGTFHALSKGSSFVDYDDFRASLDTIAEMATDDVDIEFEVKKKQNAESSTRERDIVVRRRTSTSPKKSMFGHGFGAGDVSLFSNKMSNRTPVVSMGKLGKMRFASIFEGGTEE